MSNYQDRLASLVQFDLPKADWPDALRAPVVATIVTAIPIQPPLDSAIPWHIRAIRVAISEAGQPSGQRSRTRLWTTAPPWPPTPQCRLRVEIVATAPTRPAAFTAEPSAAKAHACPRNKAPRVSKPSDLAHRLT